MEWPARYATTKGQKLKPWKYAPIIVNFDGESESLMRCFESECEAKMEKMRDGRGLDALWARAPEHAKKLATVIACGVSFDAPSVTHSIAHLAIELARHLVGSLVAEVSDVVANTDFGRVRNQILKVIKSKPAGISLTELSNVISGLGMRRRDRDDAIESLRTMGRIVEYLVPGKTRPRTVYSYVQPAS